MTGWLNLKKYALVTLVGTASVTTSYIAYTQFNSKNKEEKTQVQKEKNVPSSIDLRNIRRNSTSGTISKSFPTTPEATTFTGTINNSEIDNEVGSDTISINDNTTLASIKKSEFSIASTKFGTQKPATNISRQAPIKQSLTLGNPSIDLPLPKKVARAMDPLDQLITKEASTSNVFDRYRYALYVNASSASRNKDIVGEISVYDDVRHKQIKTGATQSLIGVNDPRNGNKSVRVVSTIFGYRPVEISFQLDAPTYADSLTGNSVHAISDSVIRVDLQLQRLNVGDIAVMWNVLFFKDASIMRPESESELDELVAMMKENKNLKIMLHGHTNGNSHGQIIHLGANDNKNFFNLDSPDHIETSGSAKKLSLYRAETIQRYLATKGIKQSRVEVTGWGGKKMMYDKHDPQADLNVRVEIEILQN